MRPDEWLQRYRGEGVGGVLPLMPIVDSLWPDGVHQALVVRAAMVHGFSMVVASSVGVDETRMWWWKRRNTETQASLLALDAGCTYVQMRKRMRDSFWFRERDHHEDVSSTSHQYRSRVVTQVGRGCPAYLVGPNDLDEFLNQWYAVIHEHHDPDDRVWAVLSELTGWPEYGLQQISRVLRG